MTRFLRTICGIAGILVLGMVSPSRSGERRWDIELSDFFVAKGTPKPLFLYARERDGQWVAVVGSSRDPSKAGKKTYNRSFYYGDLAQVPLRDGKLEGQFTLHVTPDIWVPADSKSYPIVVEVRARLVGDDKLEGDYKILTIGNPDEAPKLGRSGRLAGATKSPGKPESSAEVTYRCNLQGALVGGDPMCTDRCLVLLLGVDHGKLVSTIQGRIDVKGGVIRQAAFPLGDSTLTADADRFTAHVIVPGQTLDLEACKYSFDLEGRILDTTFVGLYRMAAKVPGKPDVTVQGSFDGTIQPGITKVNPDAERPLFVEAKDHVPPAAGEHPRLLFRKGDVPGLRKKAATPEGQAILKRLRQLLDGGDGETMPARFSIATKAYSGQKDDLPLGAYTFGHVAGYGLLYQLTGDKKYTELGRQCFERALAGVRDRDDRYSFRKPGGALRAGPTLGWYAVGYDLCYDGWDMATREKLGRAIAEYNEGQETRDARAQLTLDSLARGTMPPGSNHFGMEVGGASLALLAVRGESFVDAARIERLLRTAQQGMIRNLTEGFGDGGFFAEGDGTGSMSSHIVFLTALQGWKNADGKDFIDAPAPNARMLALKWIYQTVFRGGKPDFWPVRGAYGHNVWARDDKSGAGYFAFGFGAVRPPERAAVKWCYKHFLAEHDRAIGAPYDTVSRYPHVAVCAFVNWPDDLPEQKPETVLPHCYRDSHCGFYCWRNRWQGADDTVITVLLNSTRGYMSAAADKAIQLNCRGRHVSWGAVKSGPTRYWSTSPLGQTSSLVLSDDTCVGVDFTGASGADTLLVISAKAEGQSVDAGGRTLTFFFPTADKAPQVAAVGAEALVGRQRVGLKDGHIVFGVAGR